MSTPKHSACAADIQSQDHNLDVPSPAALPDDIVDAAITWSIKLDYNEANADIKRRFEHWLQANPMHAIAWERIHSLRHSFSGTSASSALVISTMEHADQLRHQSLLKRRKTIQLLSLANLAIGTGWLVRAQLPWQRLTADTSTGIGEQRTLQLADGTELILNTDTAIRTDLSGENRIILLLRGEIMVKTGADMQHAEKRPFLVYTSFGKMQALGTRFTVRLASQGALISVQEHAVALYPAQSQASYVVKVNESRWLRENGTEPANLHGMDAGSWAHGVISGNNIRLADLLAELARYRMGHISCAPEIADLRVSGLFHIKDTDKTLQFLADTQPIRLSFRTRLWVSVGPAHTNSDALL
ncbi:FecR domain-containing protein [Methylovorus menthalis]|uniref:FecR domain-containing protein n=1 Tax=Methylovorus menthalis TaxID=1002227 RepID=UPI001E34C830|nr:FecR domain-containing protein [Methylovorus menthalis]MCB4811902.1 FecR domain-containing protein [Methylovorus menthalis]